MAGGAKVAHFRRLMEFGAHTVAHKVPNHGEAVALHIDLDRVADVAHPAALSGVFDTLPEALLGDLDQLGRLLAHLTAGVGGGAVPVKAADVGAHIHADDIPLLQIAFITL